MHSADMLHVPFDWMFSILILEEILLNSIMIRLLSLIEGTALLLSTWQRSLELFCVSLSIQGTALCRFQCLDEDGFAFMETNDDKKIPTFDGRLESYREYRRRALLYYYGLEDSKQSIAAPRLISALTGSAFECFRERDPGEFRNTDGVKTMLEILDLRFQYTAEQELSEWLETLFYKLRRQQGEETTAFTTRFETTLAKAEELMTEELKLERRRQQDMARAEYRRQSLDYMVALQQHQAAAAATAEGETPPPAPIPPTPPRDPAPVVPFRVPEVMKGFLYLRHVGITLQTRASLLRSAGGSLRYEKVSELLRRTELDALVASRGSKAAGHGYFADFDDEENAGDQEDEYDDDFEDEDEFGGYVEDEEEEFEEEDGPVEDGDEEYDSAMIGYLEARKKLLSLRKARGFKDPPEASSGKGASSAKAGKGKDVRHRPAREGRSGRGDFQWRPGQSSSSSSARPSSFSRGRPSSQGRKSKGQGRKPKGAGKRTGGRRGDPNGAQYLGWAEQSILSPNPSPSGAPPSSFCPEFSFMVFPRSLQRISESEVERCLLWDRQLGLEAEAPDVEQACLAVPPGHAIVDTGCTSTLVGSESERRWNEELQRQSGGSLKAERGPSDVKFEGINGEARATYQVKYPVRIGGRDGFINAAVIPGKAPFLLSIQALRQMRAKLDCEKDVLDIPGIGCIKLAVNAVGHYLLPMFDFHKTPSPPPGLEHSLSAAAEADLGGPEDEQQLVAESRPGLLQTNNVVHPPEPPETLRYQPKCTELSKRTDKLAKSVMLRLARDTKGPWVKLPQELAAVHLILGRHG